MSDLACSGGPAALSCVCGLDGSAGILLSHVRDLERVGGAAHVTAYTQSHCYGNIL